MIDGTTVTLGSLTLSDVSLPTRPPLPKFRLRVKKHQMSNGSNGNGYEVVQRLGGSYKNWVWTFQHLTSSELSQLESLALSQLPFDLTITVPDAWATVYRVIFNEDGFEPSLAQYTEYTGRFYEAVCDLHIFRKIS